MTSLAGSVSEDIIEVSKEPMHMANTCDESEPNGMADTSLTSIVNAAHTIKETVQQTLKCRENQAAVPSEGIEKKLADLEQVIKCSSEVQSEMLASDSEKPTTVEAVDCDDAIPLDKLEVVEDDLSHLEASSVENVSLVQTNDPEEMNCTAEEQDSGKVHKCITGGKRKGEKTADQVLKSLSGLGTVEEKLRVLCKKHAESLDEQRSLEGKQRLSERLAIQVAREKEILQAEHNRTVLARSRLESLCRELQRQNKAMKEESLLRIREEEEKRKEIANKFQTTLNDITALMQDNQQRNAQLKEENSELAQKLKSLVDNYETWEKHMEKVVRQKELEAQLARAKLTKAHLHMREEQEKFLKEKKQLLENINILQLKSTELVKNELQLRSELGLYNSKYEEFQGVLTKSNEVFSTFKVDMDKMSKKIKLLEKETYQWKSKWENSNRTLLAMAADKQKRDQELLNSQQRVVTLEKLCRALQSERVEFQNLLRHGRSTQSCEKNIPLAPEVVENVVTGAIDNIQ